VSLVERYLELGLGLGKLVPDFVDAYYGPSEVEERVDAAPPPEPAWLAAQAGELRGRLSGELEPPRVAWLEGQLTGVETAARKLAGEEISYANEVEWCYGVRPRFTPEEEFSAAHELLEAALPGSGPLAERYEVFDEEVGVSGEELATVLESLTEELRRRTVSLFGLPDEESADFEFVTDRPWPAFNYYLGNLTSRIAVNTDLPVPATRLAELVAHEVYPGHHTEHAWKEATLVQGRGYVEETLLLIPTPQAVVAEAIAMCAVDVVAGDDGHALVAEHLYRVGREYDADVGAAVMSAREALAGVPGNTALMLHEDGASVDEARNYLVRWSLAPPGRIDQTMRFLTDSSWRSYVTCYVEGYPLGREFLRDEPERFKRLLTEQLSPSDLQAPD
jgi:hypothetical protein